MIYFGRYSRVGLCYNQTASSIPPFFYKQEQLEYYQYYFYLTELMKCGCLLTKIGLSYSKITNLILKMFQMTRYIFHNWLPLFKNNKSHPEHTSKSQVYIPSLVVVYVACRRSPADRPVYIATTPSFFIIP